ncbi:SO_0444 family Cu/Zn efflux transporter [Sulfurovum sp. zt1-1]|uniref:SO_0444 family Cu/Zn efflux transporter n=1 Tax=Sulfurovum zhangzhouensis TaxID=3019067 RepID=A0ABT7QY04_9BACT|nr:SO_0444 family Cu/Zn efflux transporter [Sulfurovum zhangzhouensis]MDM5271715.1 SO_0444 family Cu/Zn efflux transporter [Sulfurovum zhangzhouensis]
MELLIKLFENILVLANAMSFYILIGLLIAGIMKQLIPDDFISSHLGENKSASVIKATIFGIPMPVCSCSVIPLAKSLQKEGASKGAVQSFLISTPITGVDSILATYSFFGWFFTLYRVVTSVIIAIITGILQNFMDNKESVKAEESTCCSSCGCHANTVEEKKGFSSKEALKYAYVTLFGDIYKALLIGLIFGGVFTTFIPKEILEPLFEYQFLTYFAVLVIAMPLYVCATASLPIAAAFMLSGMSGGAAFVFLSAGPATNTVTMGVVAQMFGKKALILYLGSIASFSILFGYLFDTFFGKLEILNITTEVEHFSVLDTASTIVMFGLIVYYFIKNR